MKTGKRAGCTLARMEDVAVRQPRSGARIPLCGILFHMIGKFSELLYHTKALRGMRTSRLRKMSADADALRRENSTKWNSFSYHRKVPPEEPFFHRNLTGAVFHYILKLA